MEERPAAGRTAAGEIDTGTDVASTAAPAIAVEVAERIITTGVALVAEVPADLRALIMAEMPVAVDMSVVAGVDGGHG
ncbi:hypothetical protein [Actinopolymorpha alba]|uniref:hypothetical protein n=1 Tax=Actinopolymorpha alba TaxID=533267 RepID=UPI0003A1DB1D|nr:hypothetical protein [Actinopolymorpha alba]